MKLPESMPTKTERAVNTKMDTAMGQISVHGAASIAMDRPTTAASMEVATPPRTMLLKPLRFRRSD